LKELFRYVSLRGSELILEPDWGLQMPFYKIGSPKKDCIVPVTLKDEQRSRTVGFAHANKCVLYKSNAYANNAFK